MKLNMIHASILNMIACTVHATASVKEEHIELGNETGALSQLFPADYQTGKVTKSMLKKSIKKKPARKGGKP